MSDQIQNLVSRITKLRQSGNYPTIAVAADAVALSTIATGQVLEMSDLCEAMNQVKINMRNN